MMQITHGGIMRMARTETYWTGFAMGILITLLTVLAADKMFSKHESLQTALDLPTDIVKSYNLGIKDALKTNPPSWELEQTCLELWSNKK
jgi:hypothetical protein